MDFSDNAKKKYKKTKRLPYLDCAKGIGMILVVLAHIIQQAQYSNAFALITNNIIYSFHMPLSFVISGILLFLHLEKNDYRVDLKHERRYIA